MKKHFDNIFQEGFVDQDQFIEKLPQSHFADRTRTLDDWFRIAESPPRELLLHELFEAQATRMPAATALEFDDERLTYSELNERSERLARRLCRLGVAAESRVGLCVERSLDMIVGIIAILKAGGAYVPLEPANPFDRLRFIVEDAQIELLVTQTSLERSLSDLPVRLASIDADLATESEPGDELHQHSTTAESLAYIIYTSGSTGQPKGCMLTHRNVIHLFAACRDLYDFGPDDVWTLCHSFAFDFSVWEIWGALLSGGRLIIVPQDVTRSPVEFWKLIFDHGVTVLNQTPSAFFALMDAEPPSEMERLRSRLRYIIFGGERLDPRSLRHWFIRHGDQGPLLVNMYGITETTVHVTYRQLTADDAEQGGSPIGLPLPGYREYVLDEQMQPVPDGVPGELYIGGEGLARGYLNRPELTAQRFIANPFLSEPGERLYRTGDLARRLPSGELEYLGRMDFQVKIRGFRIELGEIEAAIQELQAVRQAIVLAHEQPTGDIRLIAYLLGGNEISDEAMRRELSRTLPSYMIPSAFVRVDSFPLTSSGKLDRKALPEPHFGRSDRTAYEAPHTPLQEKFSAIWSELLGVDQVGIHDNFFDLGGHSLLAGRFVTRAAAEGFEIRVRTLFENPTIAELVETITSSPGTSIVSPIARSFDAVSPASFAQQRLWFIDQLEGPGLTAYNIATASRLNGDLSVVALKQALGDLVSRHEPLRTSFLLKNGQPMQVVHPPIEVELPLEDLLHLAKTERSVEADRLASIEADRPFDLGKCPLLRARLLRIGELEHLLLLTVHHVAADGWSMHVLWRDLALAYQARLGGNTPSFPDLPVRYADFAAWQRMQLSGDRLEHSLKYWRTRLEGLEDLEVPADRPRPALLTYRGGRHDFTLAEELVTRLRGLCAQASATPHMALLAAFQLLLGRVTGREDLAVGVPVACRPRAELEGLVGFFVNTLVLRADLSGMPTFRELLRRTRNASLDAHEHEMVPFERLVEELNPQRQQNRTPLVQVIFQYLDPFAPDFSGSGLSAEALPDPGCRTRFDLEVYVRPVNGSLDVEIRYAIDLFDAATITRLAGQFQTLLSAALDSPDESIRSLPILTESERRLILDDWSTTPTPEVASECHSVTRMFAEQVALHPSATALIAGDQQLSYAEFDRQVNRLSGFLRGRGVGPDIRVAICAERSLDLMVSILAVLKAGGAYVPLDFNHPVERLQNMVSDSQPLLLLTQRRLVDQLRGLAIPIFVVDIKSPEFEAFDDCVVKESNLADSLAYVLYTSGSTGVPKGVAMGHRPLANLVRWQRQQSSLGVGARTVQFSPIGFDVSFQELFCTWCAGGTLVLITEDERRDPVALLRLMQEKQIDRIFLPFVALNELAEASQSFGLIPRSLREIITAGEQLRITPALRQMMRGLPGCTLVNQYGPTEAHVVTHHRLSPEIDTWPELPPIGRPIEGARVYVLDGELQPVPIGVPGELYLGGISLARGYLGRPDLTAERFLVDPFDKNPGARMYRTGDGSRWLANGELEFLGRLDQQVKIRGFRVELGEIEAALLQLEGVRQAAVVARNNRLVAYVAAPERLSNETLRTGLARRLPDYMIPSIIVRLDSFPLTSSGKVNRKALPEPQITCDQIRNYEAPRTLTEETIVEIWQELLGLDRAGIHDHFFELGGHSLAAMRVVGRIRHLFGVDLPVRAVFEAPTPKALARRVESALREGRGETQASAVAPLLHREDDSKNFTLVQWRFWFMDRLSPGGISYNLSSAERLVGPFDAGALARAAGEIVRRHQVLRTVFLPGTDGNPIPMILEADPGPWPVVVDDLTGMKADSQWCEVNKRLTAEAETPFDLVHGPLFRVRLIKVSLDEHVVQLTTHHIKSDGWSLDLIWCDLAAAYAAESRGEVPVLPNLPVTYGDFAAWESEWINGEVVGRQLDWWKRKLEGLPAALELPLDRPRPRVGSQGGGEIPIVVSPELASELTALGRIEGTSLFMVVLAALTALLRKYSGQEDFAVGSPVANRSHPDLDRVVGCFVNMIVLRMNLPGDPTFRELLRAARETTLDALAHQDVPFERILEAINQSRDAGHQPLVQAVLAVEDQMRSTRDWGGLVSTPVDIEVDEANFDLTLRLTNHDGLLRASLRYDSEIFEAETAARMAAHFLMLSRRACSDPDLPLSKLSMLSEGELRELALWNETRTQYPRDRSLTSLFEEHVAKSPDAPAVEDGQLILSYHELSIRAERLASRLRIAGAAPGAYVGLLFERSAEAIVAILAILKTGAAYVPLEPADPKPRLAKLLSDCGAVAVVTGRGNAKLVPSEFLGAVVESHEESTDEPPPASLLPVSDGGHRVPSRPHT